MDKIQIEEKKQSICINIPLKNDGKFRFKNRKSPFEFGIGFATRTEQFTDDSYLEWQIGFDAEKNSVIKGKKTTSLTEYIFNGPNEKDKGTSKNSPSAIFRKCRRVLSRYNSAT